MQKQKSITIFLIVASMYVLTGCKGEVQKRAKPILNKTPDQLLIKKPEGLKTPEGMIWIEGKIFTKGAKATDSFAMPREFPAHQVAVDGFFIDIHEVTNAQFSKFVKETQYITVAERPIDWEVMKNDLPPGTPKPADSVLQPGSLTFNRAVDAVVSMDNYSQWWTWKIGANWKHPEGPNSSIDGKEDLPVVHIAYEDALAYCKWAKKRLPTEAEWEAAAQGTFTDKIYTWGNDNSKLNAKANTWQGQFPVKNEAVDGYKFIAPVGSYPSNSVGLYDMLGNVWEWVSDPYNENYYRTLDSKNIILNPKGADTSYNPNNPYQKERTIKGGSFLCHASYCASFRISAKMPMTPDSSSDHTGFRTVTTPEMLSDNPK